MEMPRRLLYESFQIDANRINARGTIDAMNQLEEWRDNDVIHLDMSQVAYGEASAGDHSDRAEKAAGYIYSMTLASTPRERAQLDEIERILFPSGATTQNERNDVEVVFNALKYHRILITNDGGSKRQPGGILGNADQLRALGLRVMRDSEAVEYIRERIRQRDERARRVAAYTGESLPEWVGQD